MNISGLLYGLKSDCYSLVAITADHVKQCERVSPLTVVVEGIDRCIDVDKTNITDLGYFTKSVIPALEGPKGEAGKVGIIGGSTEYTGAPYFAAISALKVGADLVYVITTETAAPVIKSYSPDLIVYPFLHDKTSQKLPNLINKMDVVVIGPGLGRESETRHLVKEVIQTCRDLRKPMVIDADGLYFVSKNIFLLKDYPSPGVILTPNHSEERKLRESLDAVKSNNDEWFKYWGDNVTVLVKGQQDKFYSSHSELTWTLSEGGSGRRAGGQGDILSGSLGTFYIWALKADLCKNQVSSKVAASISSFAAAKFTRTCNQNAYALLGRSMTATDMINQIHKSLSNLF